MRDGAPNHFLRIDSQHLNQTFVEQWLGFGGPVSLPPRSLDHNLLAFWLWEHLERETRNILKSAHISARKGCKICRNAWEPRRASVVEIT